MIGERQMDREVLRRIAAVLLFMAHLAWRSTGERASVRADRLFYLGRAEAIAMAFAAGEDREEGHRLAALATLHRRCDKIEALRLSLSFRLLALIVLNIAALTVRPPQPLLRVRPGAACASFSGAGSDFGRAAPTCYCRGTARAPPPD